MGGTVAVTVRLESGEEYRMNRWTNALPFFFNNLKFFQKDRQHINEYLQQWKDMRDDWNKNHAAKKFEYNMTECYSPYPALLAPCDYGIVVFDFMKNAVVSCQSYSGFHYNMVYPKYYSPELYQAQTDLFKNNRILKIRSFNELGGEVFNDPPKTLKDLKKLLEGKDVFLKSFIYDTSPFKVHQFSVGDSDELKETKKIILDLGFQLSDEESKEWDKSIKDQEDDEKEDEDV
jgi:hypothetical protein